MCKKLICGGPITSEDESENKISFLTSNNSKAFGNLLGNVVSTATYLEVHFNGVFHTNCFQGFQGFLVRKNLTRSVNRLNTGKG